MYVRTFFSTYLRMYVYIFSQPAIAKQCHAPADVGSRTGAWSLHVADQLPISSLSLHESASSPRPPPPHSHPQLPPSNPSLRRSRPCDENRKVFHIHRHSENGIGPLGVNSQTHSPPFPLARPVCPCRPAPLRPAPLRPAPPGRTSCTRRRCGSGSGSGSGLCAILNAPEAFCRVKKERWACPVDVTWAYQVDVRMLLQRMLLQKSRASSRFRSCPQPSRCPFAFSVSLSLSLSPACHAVAASLAAVPRVKSRAVYTHIHRSTDTHIYI